MSRCSPARLAALTLIAGLGACTRAPKPEPVAVAKIEEVVPPMPPELAGAPNGKAEPPLQLGDSLVLASTPPAASTASVAPDRAVSVATGSAQPAFEGAGAQSLGDASPPLQLAAHVGPEWADAAGPPQVASSLAPPVSRRPPRKARAWTGEALHAAPARVRRASVRRFAQPARLATLEPTVSRHQASRTGPRPLQTTRAAVRPAPWPDPISRVRALFLSFLSTAARTLRV